MKKIVLFSTLIIASAGAFAETAKSEATPAAPAKAATHEASKTTQAKNTHGKETSAAAKSKSTDAKSTEVAPADKPSKSSINTYLRSALILVVRDRRSYTAIPFLFLALWVKSMGISRLGLQSSL